MSKMNELRLTSPQYPHIVFLIESIEEKTSTPTPRVEVEVIATITLDGPLFDIEYIPVSTTFELQGLHGKDVITGTVTRSFYEERRSPELTIFFQFS